MSTFEKYSAFYDLLYQDKDYDAEAAYVAAKLRAASPGVRTVLELGSGTGRHGRLMAVDGFEVYGIERSAEMVAVARGKEPEAGAGRFDCEVGDICRVALDRQFDAVISLFHVISYQTTNDALHQVFDVASQHLKPGGVFLFDVWHGPAVLTEQPAERIKSVTDGVLSVERTARPTLDTNLSTVNVHFDMKCHDAATGERVEFGEDHLMRYLFPTEIEFLAKGAGLEIVATEEFLTGAPPASTTWGVAYSLQKPMSETQNV